MLIDVDGSAGVRPRALVEALEASLADWRGAERTRELIGGDLNEAASRYIANVDLAVGKSNPDVLCDFHLAVADYWLNIVATAPVSSQADRDAKLRAL